MKIRIVNINRYIKIINTNLYIFLFHENILNLIIDNKNKLIYTQVEHIDKKSIKDYVAALEDYSVVLVENIDTLFNNFTL